MLAKLLKVHFELRTIKKELEKLEIYQKYFDRYGISDSFHDVINFFCLGRRFMFSFNVSEVFERSSWNQNKEIFNGDYLLVFDSRFVLL